MNGQTVHGVALQLAGNGIIIVGQSGSGKTSLALDLIDHCQLRGIAARLVADDRVTLKNREGDWVASAPEPLRGLVEVRGSGIHEIDFLEETQLHLAIRLVAQSQALRMPECEPQEISPAVFLPCLTLPQNGDAALRAVLAHFGLYAGVKPQRHSN